MTDTYQVECHYCGDTVEGGFRDFLVQWFKHCCTHQFWYKAGVYLKAGGRRLKEVVA